MSRGLCCSETLLKFTSQVSRELSSLRNFDRDMSGQTVPADFSGHMLDLDEDEDLEVFSKVQTNTHTHTRCVETRRELQCSLFFMLRGFDPLTQQSRFYRTVEVNTVKESWSRSVVHIETTHCHRRGSKPNFLDQLMS